MQTAVREYKMNSVEKKENAERRFKVHRVKEKKMVRIL